MGAATMAPLIRRLCPDAEIQFRERFSTPDLRGPEEADAPAAAQRRRRLLGRGRLRDRRADPPPARRRGGGDGLAQPPHPQRPGRALPVRRGRLPGRDRRDRHGPQHGRRPCRLRRPAQVRRPAHALPHRAGDRPDRRPRGALSPRRRRSASPATRPTSTPTWSPRSRATPSSRSPAAEWRNARLDFDSLQGLHALAGRAAADGGAEAVRGEPRTRRRCAISRPTRPSSAARATAPI